MQQGKVDDAIAELHTVESRDPAAKGLALEMGTAYYKKSDFPKAIEYLKKESPDVVLIDRRMPDPETGVESVDTGDKFLEQVVGRWRYVCPIMLTNFGDPSDVRRLTRYGAWQYFQRGTFEYEELHKACRDGMRMYLVKRARRDLLTMNGLDQVVPEVSRYVVKLFEVSPCFTFLQVSEQGSLWSWDRDSAASVQRS